MIILELKMIELFLRLELEQSFHFQHSGCWASCGAPKAQGTKAKAKVQSP